MKKLFLFLLKKYSKTEDQRFEIYKTLFNKVQDTYTKQTIYGNVYNAHIEFIMSNDFVRKLVENNKYEELNMIKGGINNSTDKAFRFIKNEPRKLKLKKLI